MKRFQLIRTTALGLAISAGIMIAGVSMPAQAAFAGSGPALSSGDPGTAQLCTGSGADHKCLYCVYYDGGKDCFWLKAPEKPKPAGEGRPGDLAATGDSEAKEQFSRAKPHVDATPASADSIASVSECRAELDDGTFIIVPC